MEITPHTLQEPLSLPPSLYSSVVIAEAKKDGQTLLLRVGLDRELVRQLKERSLDESDEAVQSNTSDRKRFGEGSYEGWYSGNRTPFALVDTSGRLAALAWFGPKDAPIAEKEEALWHTIAYRSYPPYRGAGIMGDFTRFVLEYYRRLIPGVRIWAEVKAGNTASVALAKKLGFEERAPLLGRAHGVILTD